MERKEAIRGAYRMTGGNSFYDGMITCSTLSGKAVCRLVWAMNKAENNAYLEKAMSGIPEHFSGKLLEVPVGTGILTMPVYQTMPEADSRALRASIFSDISLTIAMTPSDFVWQGFMQGKKDGCKEWPMVGESLFSYKGKALAIQRFAISTLTIGA